MLINLNMTSANYDSQGDKCSYRKLKLKRNSG